MGEGGRGAPGAAVGAGRTCRIGCGAGFSNDRIEPARDLAERGALDFLVFECLAERTLAQAHAARRLDPAAGFDPRLRVRLEAVLAACHANGTRIVTNAGSANPRAAGAAAREVARALGLGGLRIAVVEGDDVAHLLTPDLPLIEPEASLLALDEAPIGANAYLGAAEIVAALDAGADLVITGRCADPALVLGPLVHYFGWPAEDWALMGAGTLVGHLLECGCQITGGYFADPGRKEVPDLAWLGYPLAEVAADGSAVISKLPGTGGLVTPRTVLEQMLYEVHDPAAYVTPDVIADFSAVEIAEAGSDVVSIRGAGGRARPDAYKVTVGFDGGYLAEAEIGYAGLGAADRARLAERVMRTRMTELHGCADEIRSDLVGLASLHAGAVPEPRDGRDVRLRMALRSRDREMAHALVREMEAMWIAGPAGGGGVRGRVVPSVVTRSALIDRALVQPRHVMVEA